MASHTSLLREPDGEFATVSGARFGTSSPYEWIYDELELTVEEIVTSVNGTV